MSRSFKKHLIKKVAPVHACFAKNQANRKIRRISPTEDIANGKSYRKYTDPWNIHDWVMHYDPYPHQGYAYGKGLTTIEPDPIWKWRCK